MKSGKENSSNNHIAPHKRLLIVGNKMIDNDISDIVGSYDLVVRYNKMDNSDKTSIKYDVYFPSFDISDFLKKISRFKLQTICNSRQFIALDDSFEDISRFDMVLGQRWRKGTNKIIIKTQDLINYFNLNVDVPHFRHYQSMCLLILLCIYYYSNEYTIDATAFDLDRQYFKGNNWHTHSDEERDLLEKLVKEGRFRYLDAETLGNKNNQIKLK